MKHVTVVLLLTLLLPLHAAASLPDDPPTTPDGFALGVTATPAITGSGAWLMPALRLTTPLGGPLGLDVESGAIFEAGNIQSYLAAQLRIAHTTANARAPSTYWLAGVRSIPRTTAPPGTDLYRQRWDTSVMIGYGWKQRFPSGARALMEIGAAGGDVFMAFATIGVQFGAR
jgi:hypothetical protein